MLYAIPILVLALILTTAAVTLYVVSHRSATSEGKTSPFAQDAGTPLGATDELSDAPLSEQRAA